MSRSLGFTITNFLAFQAGWFACVLGAANNMPWLGPVVVSAVVMLHVKLVHNAAQELRLAGLALVTGLAFDSLLLSTGWISYSSGIIVSGLAPLWILAMWVLFATTLNVSMGWLKGKPLLAALMGGVFGPLSYMAGSRFGAMEFINAPAALVMLAVGWAIAMPFLMAMAGRFNGVSSAAIGGHAHDGAAG